ncbi:MAG: DMT family transporter [Candidatus Nanopelagicales bacterium]|jgi:drug/metabolite transporter (DMT)-like permease|nr:DMT family transporter [Candidatus Nanopelagicales bacterium]MDP4715492.1 DMT family transporter [Candidatus Nanopelagicales bacterium]MDP4907242.1 DMT family transporter [Candidatus Nanopelagicales bacterium]
MTQRGWTLFIALSVIWGTPYLFIRIAVDYVEPSVMVALRVGLAAALLLPVALMRGQFRGIRRYLPWIGLFALVEITGPFLMLGYAETQLTSSTTALLIAGVPIVAAVLARSLGLDRRLGGMRVLGLAVGLSGVAILVGLDVPGDQWWAVGAAAVTVVGYALGPIIISTRLAEAPALAVITLALAANTVLYAPIAWVQRPTTPVPASAWWSIVILGVLCTAIAFLIFFALVAEVGPSRMTVITFLNPAVAVFLGIVILSEPITWGLVLGFPLVLLGSYLATRPERNPAGVIEDTPHP